MERNVLALRERNDRTDPDAADLVPGLAVPTAVVTALVLSLAGAAVAAYLTWAHYDPAMLTCGVGDCHRVQSSSYATVGPFPIALLGLGMFLVVAAFAVVRWLRPDLSWPVSFAAFMLALCGVIYFVYLTYLEIAVIGAVCQWCVLAAGVTVGLLVAETMNIIPELRGS